MVVIIGSLQPLNAQLRHMKGVGHPKPDGSRTDLRKKWEFLHKGCGYVAVAGGIINVVLGVIHADNVGFGHGLVPAAAVLAGMLTGSVVVGFMSVLAKGAVSYEQSLQSDSTGDEATD